MPTLSLDLADTHRLHKLLEQDSSETWKVGPNRIFAEYSPSTVPVSANQLTT
jgi:hypothetical protein